MKELHSCSIAAGLAKSRGANSRLQSLKEILSSPTMLGLALISFLLLGLLRSNWVTFAWFLVGVLVCLPPGWLSCKLIYGLEFAKRLDSLGHTLILGLLLITFLSIVIAVLGLGLTVPTMLIASLGGTLLLFLLGRWMASPLSVPQENDPAITRIAITIGLLVVVATIAVPILNVGREVGDYHAYAPQFDRDFLRNIAIGAQLSKGIVPPANPFYESETLHYYWFQMVFPALIYRLSGLSISLENTFLLCTLLVDVIFVFVFVHFIRRFVETVPALIIVLGLGFVAESYQAPFKALLLLQPYPWSLEGTWLGAISLPPVGYFFQSLLYLPHHFIALAAFLIASPLLIEQSIVNRLKRTLTAAIILLVSGGFSFFIIGFGFVWAGSYLFLQGLKTMYLAIRNYKSGQYRSQFITIILAGIVIGLAGIGSYGSLSGLEMLLTDTDSWQISLSEFPLLIPVHLFVMLGPMLITGLIGFVLCVRDRKIRPDYYGLLWLSLSIALAVIFAVPPVQIGTWELSQKLGTVLRIGALALSGVFLDRLTRSGIARHKVAGAIIILFCVSATPNLLAYEYVHVNIKDSDLLTYIPAPDKKAAEWMRQHTSLDSIIQAWPASQTRSTNYAALEDRTYSLVPVFGERQTAVGDPQFARYFVTHLKHQDIAAREEELSQIYEKPSQSDVAGILKELHIDYIYWGVSERQCCLRNLSWYETSSLFQKVYDQDGVSIFRFQRE